MTTDIQPPIDLPVWRLVKASLASVFRHLDNFAARVWPWVAVVAIATAVMGLGFDMTFEEKSAASGIVGLLLLVGPAMIVVSWHRGLLLGESGGPATAFRLDRPFWRYVGVGIVMALLMVVCVGLPAVAIGALLSTITAPQNAVLTALLIGVILLIVSLPLTSRLLLALPMAAIDAEPPLLRGAWRLGNGNGWNLFCGLFFVSLVTAIVQIGLLLPVYIVFGIGSGEDAAAFINGAAANLVLQPLTAALTMLNASLLASYASYAFAVLTNHPLGRDVTG